MERKGAVNGRRSDGGSKRGRRGGGIGRRSVRRTSEKGEARRGGIIGLDSLDG